MRRPVAVRHLLAKTPEGFELRVDLAEMPSSGRAPSVEPPPAPRPQPEPPPPVPRDLPRPVAKPFAPPAEQGRVLGGHVFLTPAGFASPFVDTRFGLTLGLAHAAFPAVDTRDGSRYTAQLGALSLRADLAVRLSSRLGLVASGTGAATSGINAPSALNLGANGGGTWMLGLEGIAARIERTGTQVAARVSAEGSAGGRINSLAQLFNQAIAARQVPQFSAVLGSLASTTGRFQSIAAQAIGSHASVQASLGWDATWTSPPAGPTEHTLDVTGGVAFTVDAAPRVPLAVLVEYDGERGPEPQRGSIPGSVGALVDAGHERAPRRDLLFRPARFAAGRARRDDDARRRSGAHRAAGEADDEVLLLRLRAVMAPFAPASTRVARIRSIASGVRRGVAACSRSDGLTPSGGEQAQRRSRGPVQPGAPARPVLAQRLPAERPAGVPRAGLPGAARLAGPSAPAAGWAAIQYSRKALAAAAATRGPSPDSPPPCSR